MAGNKEYDWFVATMNHPTYDTNDFVDLGMTLDNTLLKPVDFYIQLPKIRELELFLDDNGSFNELKLRDFYSTIVPRFNDFIDNDNIRTFRYDVTDLRRRPGDRMLEPVVLLSALENPELISFGVVGFNLIGNPLLSRRELALANKIHDYKTGKVYNKSINDLALTVNPKAFLYTTIFGDAYTYAVYDKDTLVTDAFSGLQRIARKGEWKTDANGNYYVETLGGRSPMDNEVIPIFDYLTAEDQWINKYDFFDADGLEKNVSGTLVRSVVSAVPMFIPYVRGVYTTLMVAKEMMRATPMLYGMFKGFMGSDLIATPMSNAIGAFGEKFTLGTSDYDKLHTFTANNIANLMGEVAVQWGVQRNMVRGAMKMNTAAQDAYNSAMNKARLEYINGARAAVTRMRSLGASAALIVSYTGMHAPEDFQELLRTGDWATKSMIGRAAILKYMPAAEKIAMQYQYAGLNLSLAYMAIISNTDVYQAMLLHGATPQEAALVTFGSIVGMFSVDKYMHLGEAFFLEPAARTALRLSAVRSAEEMMGKDIKTAAREAIQGDVRKNAMTRIARGMQVGRNAITRYYDRLRNHNLSFLGRALGEGLEEVSEELVTDITRLLALVAGELGYFSLTDYGAWDNGLERYAMNFLGGFAGGTMFGGFEYLTDGKLATRKIQDDAAYLIRQGRKDELLREYKRMYDNGLLGSKALSATPIQGEDGSVTYGTALTEQESQAYLTYDLLVKSANWIEAILTENGLNLTEDGVLDKITQGEWRHQLLTDFLKGDKNRLGLESASFFARVHADYDAIVRRIIDKQGEIELLYGTAPSDAATRDERFKEQYDKLKAEKEALIKERDEMFGEGSLRYVDKMLFAIDPVLSSKFMTITFNAYVRLNYGKAVEELTPAELSSAREDWRARMNGLTESVDEAYRTYRMVADKTVPLILSLHEEIAKVKEYTDPFSHFLRYDDRIPTETDEDYNDRYTRREGETAEQLNLRAAQRQAAINAYNELNLPEWINETASQGLSYALIRRLELRLNLLILEIRSNLIEQNVLIADNVSLAYDVWNILKSMVDIDPMNADLRTRIEDIVKKAVSAEVDAKWGDWDTITRQYALYGLDSSTTDVTNKEVFDDMMAYIMNNDDVAMPTTDEEALAILVGMLGDTEVPVVFDDTPLGRRNSAAIKFFMDVQNGNISADDSSGDNIVAFSYTTYKNEISSLISQRMLLLLDAPDALIKRAANAIANDRMINAILNLRKASITSSPIVKILADMTRMFHDNPINIEDFLLDIYLQYISGATTEEFLLSDDQMELLQLFKTDLEILSTVIYSAWMHTSYGSPIGHNHLINEYILNHRDVYKSDALLPVLENMEGGFALNEILQYINEIDSWILRSDNNSYNMSVSSLRAGDALNKTRADFWVKNRGAFTIEKQDPDDPSKRIIINLLEGVEIDALSGESSFKALYDIENAVHQNFLQAIAKGWTIEEILDWMLANTNNTSRLVTDVTTIAELKVARLDAKLTYSKFTEWDKVAYAISTMVVDNDAFYGKIIDMYAENDQLVPLPIQQYVARMVYAQATNVRLIDRALTKIALLTGISMPVLYGGSISIGTAGGGKTLMITVAECNRDDKVWAVCPKMSLAERLQKTLNGKVASIEMMTLEDLVKKIDPTDADAFIKPVDYYKSLKKSSTKKGEAPKKSVWVQVTGLSDMQSAALNSALPISNVSDPKNPITKLDKANRPTLIVIDEATWANTAMMALISKFMEVNNSMTEKTASGDTIDLHPIRLMVIGDDYQNGYYSKDSTVQLSNILRTVLFGWRTPKLHISLRQDNALKSRNMAGLIGIIDILDASVGIKGRGDVLPLVLRLLANYTLHFYEDEKTFFGDRIVASVTDDMLSVIKSSNSVKYIGNAEDELFKTLAGKIPSLLYVAPDDVLGDEFSYAIINKSWGTNFRTTTEDIHALDIYRFVKDFYTMISRSRSGSLIVDKNNISNIIKNSRDKASPVLRNIVDARDIFMMRFGNEMHSIGLDRAGMPTETPASTETSTDTYSPPSPEEKRDEKESTEGSLPESVPTNEEPSSTTEPPASEEDSPTSIIVDTSRMLPAAKDLSRENTPYLNNTDLNEDMITDPESIQSTPLNSARAYTNISVRNVPETTTTEIVDGKEVERKVWTNDGKHTDVGIFMEEGELTSDGLRMDQLVEKVMLLKSVFTFTSSLGPDGAFEYYDRLSPDIRSLISIEALRGAKMYIRIANAEDINKFIGFTNLDNDNRTIGEGLKFVTLVVKFIDNNGNICTLTLAAFANPLKWFTEIERQSLLVDLEKRLTAELTQEAYSAAKLYSDAIDRITNEELEEGASRDIYINTPSTIRAFAELVKLPEPIRMQNMDNDARPYDALIHYSRRSAIMIVMDPKQLGVSESLKGKAVIFESPNILLNPGELLDLYIMQKNGLAEIELVRMIVLNTLGVSFDSLRNMQFRSAYSFTAGKWDYDLPFDAGPTGIRMFRAMWNYRAALIRFLNSYESYIDVTGYDLDGFALEDAKVYSLLSEEYTKEHDGLILDEDTYRLMVGETALRPDADEDKQLKEVLKALWDFNDALMDVRFFRLGYSRQNGAYIRTLTNVTLRRDRSKARGIYINHDLAVKYLNVLNTIFEELVDKVVNIGDYDPETYIANSEYEVKLGEQQQYLDEATWYRLVRGGGTLVLPLSRFNPLTNEEILTGLFITMTNDNPFALLTYAMALLGHNLNAMRQYELAEASDYIRAFKPITINKEEIAWEKIYRALENDDEHVLGGTYKTRSVGPFEFVEPGIVPMSEDVDGNKIGLVDHRFTNFFSLMFHGLTSTSIKNDFTRNDIRATDAEFPYGFFIDPIIKLRNSSELPPVAAAVLMERGYAVGARVGFPIITFTISEFLDAINGKITEEEPSLVTGTTPAVASVVVDATEALMILEYLDKITDELFEGLDDSDLFKALLRTDMSATELIDVIQGALKDNVLQWAATNASTRTGYDRFFIPFNAISASGSDSVTDVQLLSIGTYVGPSAEIIGLAKVDDNTIEVRINNHDGTTKVYTITLLNDAGYYAPAITQIENITIVENGSDIINDTARSLANEITSEIVKSLSLEFFDNMPLSIKDKINEISLLGDLLLSPSERGVYINAVKTAINEAAFEGSQSERKALRKLLNSIIDSLRDKIIC